MNNNRDNDLKLIRYSAFEYYEDNPATNLYMPIRSILDRRSKEKDTKTDK